MSFKSKYRIKQTENEKGKTIEIFFNSIDFPVEWRDKETNQVVERMIFNSSVKYFSDFRDKNDHNRKFNSNFSKINPNFSLNPLFQEINSKKKYLPLPLQTKPSINSEIEDIFDLLYMEIYISRVFYEKIFMGEEYRYNYLLTSLKLYYDLFYQCVPLIVFKNRSIFNEIITIDKSVFIPSNDFIDSITLSIEQYKKSYNKLLEITPFNYFSDDVFDSLTRLFKIISTSIYKGFLDNKIEKVDSLNALLDKILETNSEGKKNMMCKSSSDILYSYLYLFQKKINYSNEIRIYDDLLNEKEIIENYKQTEREHEGFFRINTNIESDFEIKKFNKEEFYNILNLNKIKKDYSNFIRKINSLDNLIEKFNSMSISNLNNTELKKYYFLYQEFIDKNYKIGEKGRALNKIIKDLENNKKINREERNYLSLKCDRVNFCTKYGIDNYIEYVVFQKKILEILQIFSYERDGENLFSIMTLLLNHYKDNLLNKYFQINCIKMKSDDIDIKIDAAYSDPQDKVKKK